MQYHIKIPLWHVKNNQIKNTLVVLKNDCPYSFVTEPSRVMAPWLVKKESSSMSLCATGINCSHQKQLGRAKVWFSLQVIAHHWRKSGWKLKQELRDGPGCYSTEHYQQTWSSAHPWRRNHGGCFLLGGSQSGLSSASFLYSRGLRTQGMVLSTVTTMI